jgi:hypothetical protein
MTTTTSVTARVIKLIGKLDPRIVAVVFILGVVLVAYLAYQVFF